MKQRFPRELQLFKYLTNSWEQMCDATACVVSPAALPSETEALVHCTCTEHTLYTE